MSRDEARYPNVEQFMPERFLNVEGTLTDDDPAEFIFGFGRRICPGRLSIPQRFDCSVSAYLNCALSSGRYTADASVWSAIVTMLATLEFHHAKDADDNDVVFTPTFANGIAQYVQMDHVLGFWTFVLKDLQPP